MKWLLSKFLASVIKIMLDVIKLISINFLTNFGINIGGKFPTINHPRTPSLSGTIKSFNGIMAGNTSGASLFDTLFGGAKVFAHMIYVTAFLIAIFLIAVSIIKTFSDPFARNDHPVKAVTRGIFAGMCTLLSYRIMLTLEYPAHLLYLSFLKASCSKKVLGAGVDASGFLSGKADAVAGLSRNLTTMLSPDSGGVFMKALNTSAAGVAFRGALKIAALLLLLFLIFMILAAFIKLILEIVERYILLGLLFYSAPLAFSSFASKEGTKVFKQWLQMIFSQFLLMISSTFFICVFIGGLNYAATVVSKHGANISFSTYLVFLCAVIAWLDVGVRADRYLKALGLNAAQCGNALWFAMAGSFRKTKGVYMRQGKGVKERLKNPGVPD